MRIVLQYTDRSFDRIKTRPTALQNFAARPERVFESSAIFLLFLRRHFASLDCAGATMDRELDFFSGIFDEVFLPCATIPQRAKGRQWIASEIKLNLPKEQRDCF